MKALVTLPNNKNFSTVMTDQVKEMLCEKCELIFNEKDCQMTVEEIKDKIGDCDAYITCWGSPRLDKEILDSAPNLKLLIHVAGTVVPFVSDEMWDRGIRVISGNEYFAQSTAEGAFTYILSALRRIPFFTDNLKNNGKWWDSINEPNNGLLYKKVGIVGYGAVAKNLIKMLQPFHVDINVFDIVEIPQSDKEKYNITQCPIEEIFKTCDVISIHVPLNDKTHHLVDDSLMSLIKKDALFVNTARGGVVDENALIKHLEAGHFNAALDVYESEPLPKDSPLLKLNNVHATPHQAGPTLNLRSVIASRLISEGIEYIDNGKPLVNEITRDRAENMSKF